MSRISRVFVLLLLVLPATPAAFAATTEPLSIHTADGRILAFKVEVATSEAERETGLMNRPTLAPDAGMIFDFDEDQPVAMWMKNTLIPLDMLFVAKDGTITGIRERAIPEDLTIIPSPGPVRAVIELNGGTADRLGIHVGDRVEDRLFPPGQ